MRTKNSVKCLFLFYHFYNTQQYPFGQCAKVGHISARVTPLKIAKYINLPFAVRIPSAVPPLVLKQRCKQSRFYFQSMLMSCAAISQTAEQSSVTWCGGLRVVTSLQQITQRRSIQTYLKNSFFTRPLGKDCF